MPGMHEAPALTGQGLLDIFDGMVEAVLVLDRDLRICAANRRALDMHGRSAGELVGRVCWDVWPAMRSAEIEAAFRDCLERRAGATLEHRWMTELGERGLLVRVLPVDGGMAAFCQELPGHALRLAEGDLVEQLLHEDEVRPAGGAQARAGTWVTDFRTGQVQWSGGTRALLGLPADAVASTAAFFERVHPDEMDRVRAEIAAALSGTSSVYQIDYRIRRADTGEERWLAGHGRIEREASGRAVRVAGVNLDITEQRSAELERETILRSIGEGFALLDEQQRLVYVNPAAERLIGLPADRLLGRSHRELFPEAGSSVIEREYRRAAEEKLPVVFENYSVSLGRWFEVRAYPNASGGLAVHFRDITQRKSAELALAESEERFRGIVQDQVEMICRFRRDGTLLFVNPAYAADCGRPISELKGAALQGASFFDRLPAADRRSLRRVLDRLSDERPAHTHVHRVSTRDRGMRWQEWTHRRLGPDLFQGTGRDVTERKLAEDIVRQSEARLRLALRAGGLVPWEAEPDTGRVIAGPELAELFGMDPQQAGFLAGYFNAVLPDDRSRVMAEMAGMDRRGQICRTDFRIRRADGAVRWIVAVVEAVEEEGRLRTIGFSEDVTERRRAEEARALLMREVDHRAKNVMAVVQALVGLTRADSVAAFKSAVTGRVEAMARAHALLAHSKWHSADLRTIVGDELEAYQDRCSIDGPPVPLRAAMVQPVALAVHELATNAVKHGALSVPHGHVAVSWSQRPRSGDIVLRWTERGGPVTAPPTRSGFGSTLLSRGIEDQADGRVRLFWEPDELQCEIRLPAGAVQADADDTAGQAAAAPVVAPMRDGPVLIVEDQPLVAMQLERMLASMGRPGAIRATRLADAFVLLEREAFGVVLLDADLQGTSSQPLARELERRGIPYVWCTGYDDVPGGSRGAPVLSKPYDQEVLAGLLAVQGMRA